MQRITNSQKNMWLYNHMHLCIVKLTHVALYYFIELFYYLLQGQKLQVEEMEVDKEPTAVIKGNVIQETRGSKKIRILS